MRNITPPPPPPIRAKPAREKVARKPRPKVQKKKANPRHRKPVRKELSAGGVAVREEAGTYLVALLRTEHKRGEVWVLPKGHVEMETGERVSEAARREVEEEAGIKDLSVKNQLGVTRFSFQAEGVLIKKTVHYFLMMTQQKKLFPQEEERFIDADWFPIDDAVQKLEYDTDQDIVLKAKSILTGSPMPPKTPRRKPFKSAAPKSKKAVRLHA